MQSVIRLENVSKRFGSQVALDDVTLDVPEGKVFALLGENGAGKTTAIRIMLGLAQPDSGAAQVLGFKSAKQSLEIRRRVGYVPEQPTLYDWMTVAEIGWFAAGFYGDGFLSRYLALAGEFGLPQRRKIKTLSKGMRAKVSLSLAVANDPDLLVLDEPTSGLDALVRREFLESMVDRAAAGQTVFLSSHQIGEVERVADVIAIIRNGRLALVEQLDELKGRVRELTITVNNGTPPPPELLGDVLSERRKLRQWQLMVSSVADDQLAGLRGHPAVQEVDVRAPSLEEIFVAYMQTAPEPADDSGAVEEVSLP